MNSLRSVLCRTILVSAFLVSLVLLEPMSQAQTYSVLYSFSGGTDGALPEASLIRDGAGNLYGSTTAGGIPGCAAQLGCGTIFKLDTNGRYKLLHQFVQTEGNFPRAPLSRDPAGNLYGTTWDGGAYLSGVVFKVDTSGAETVLHNFSLSVDGFEPYGGLVRDGAGNFYGTTGYGGPNTDWGTVFKLAPSGTVSLLHTFAAGADGQKPWASLIRDSSGNLYGTTYKGGGTGCVGAAGCGTVFKIDSGNQYSILYSFTGMRVNGDGSHPFASLLRDVSGNLYGTTYDGGLSDRGAIFQLDSSGHETVLYSFGQSPDGANPQANVVMDASGNLYGTTMFGGTGTCQFGCGIVFKLDKNGVETVLHNFAGGTDGAYPAAGLVLDPQSNLYGTTSGGGQGTHCGSAGGGCGTVFKITPQ